MSAKQPDLFESEAARSVLDQLLEESRLYHTSADYRQLLDFTIKLRNFAPFNAMLLQIQKPGLHYAASAYEWREKFNRKPKRDARPLLILWPFGPVMLVYDELDTEGAALPSGVRAFQAIGDIAQEQMKGFLTLMARKNIHFSHFDGGDGAAGSIEVTWRAPLQMGKLITPEQKTRYLVRLNSNHSPAVQFSTLAHELGHLFLGHLGLDKALKIPERPQLSHGQMELEAESVAYVVCGRNGVACESKTYLANYVTQHTTVGDIDVYQIMRAAGQIETLLKLTAHTSFGPHSSATKDR